MMTTCTYSLVRSRRLRAKVAFLIVRSIGVLAVAALVACGASDRSAMSTAAVESDATERVSLNFTLEPRENSTYIRAGADDSLRYGFGLLAGQAEFRGGSMSIELLCSIEYRNGSGPFSGFWTLSTATEDVMVFRYSGSATTTDAGVDIDGAVELIDAAGVFAGLTGSGVVRGSRSGDVGTAVSYTMTLDLIGLSKT